ncbi:hypothetical protein OAP46_00550 [bacterium]|nr:hypothetical protein [bacterium]
MMGKNEKKLTQTSPPGVQHQPFYEPTNIIDPRYLANVQKWEVTDSELSPPRMAGDR